MKKLSALFLALVLLVSAVPTAFAANTTPNTTTLTTTVRRIRPFFLFRWVGQCVGRRNMHYFLWVLVITYLLYHSCM